MFFTTTLSLLLALAPATLLAAPTPTQSVDSIANLIPRGDLRKAVNDGPDKKNGMCDVSKITLPVAPTPLAAVSNGATLRHVVIGRGTQNYTCATASADAAPVANGAMASLFDVTCDYSLVTDAVMARVTAIALDYSIPKGPEISARLIGHHEFTEKGIPLFKLDLGPVSYGYVQAKPDPIKSSAPKDAVKGQNKMGSVQWLKLNAVEGDYKDVYRVNTAGGMAPKTCQGIQGSFTVEYSAQYFFYA